MPFTTRNFRQAPPTHAQALVCSLGVGLSLIGAFGFVALRHVPTLLAPATASNVLAFAAEIAVVPGKIEDSPIVPFVRPAAGVPAELGEPPVEGASRCTILVREGAVIRRLILTTETRRSPRASPAAATEELRFRPLRSES